MNNRTVNSIPLSELVNQVKVALQSGFPMPVWIVAEISELSFNRAGHCYLELIEKDAASDKIMAKGRATIWANVFRVLRPYFESVTGETLKAGMKVMCKATVEFHEVFGFSLNITDINPEFTLGDIARKRMLIIEQLKAEGVFDMNKSCSLATVPQRLAVISSETAAGYGDFCKQLGQNQFQIHFQVKLFSAIMQGETAAQSVINAIEQIYDRFEEFDAVVIIRGGGSKSDLSCFDDYNLAYVITQFPLPVLTGIGHDRDETITDLVAHTNLKTPTAVAEFLIQQANGFYYRLHDATNRFGQSTQQWFDEQFENTEQLSDKLSNELRFLFEKASNHLVRSEALLKLDSETYLKNQNKRVLQLSDQLKRTLKGSVNTKVQIFEHLEKSLAKSAHTYFRHQTGLLTQMEQNIRLVDPQAVLNRGFAIVTHQQKVVTDAGSVTMHDQLNIKLAQGELAVEVIENKTENLSNKGI